MFTAHDLNELAGAPAELLKGHRAGTHRAIAPELTLERVRPHLAAAGITRVSVVTGLDVIGIPTVMVARPAARNLSVAQGKGANLVLAKVSGVMEALEHFHAESPELGLRYASRSELLAREDVVEVSRLPAALRTFSDDVSLLWAPARRLPSNTPVWVPFELVHLDFRLPLPAGSGYFAASSTGLASGNHAVEATCHALFEIIERHSTATFYELPAERQAQLRLDLGSVTEESCSELLARFASAGVSVGVWDATGALGVPCFICDVIDQDAGGFRRLQRARGMGCHSDRVVALTRALCEAAQSRLTFIAGSRDDIQADELELAQSVRALERAQGQLSATGQRRFEHVTTWDFLSFQDELAWLLQRLGAAGYEDVAVVDLSKERFPIAVVRAIVPGLLVAPHPRCVEA